MRLGSLSAIQHVNRLVPSAPGAQRFSLVGVSTGVGGSAVDVVNAGDLKKKGPESTRHSQPLLSITSVTLRSRRGTNSASRSAPESRVTSVRHHHKLRSQLPGTLLVRWPTSYSDFASEEASEIRRVRDIRSARIGLGLLLDHRGRSHGLRLLRRSFSPQHPPDFSASRTSDAHSSRPHRNVCSSRDWLSVGFRELFEESVISIRRAYSLWRSASVPEMTFRCHCDQPLWRTGAAARD